MIEIMIVVALLSILGMIAIPQFAAMVRKSREGATKGSLGSLRSALSIYYGDMEGQYPIGIAWGGNSSVLGDALVPKYIDAIPNIYAADYHGALNTVYCHHSMDYNHDGSGWGYDGCGYWTANPDSNWGLLWIFCSHTDTKSANWQSY